VKLLKKKSPKAILITPDKEQMVRDEFNKALVQTWKSCYPICPKMILDFHVNFVEVYSSRPGYILTLTPLWRGPTFTRAVLAHEFYHWSFYPVDMFRGLEDLFRSRELLAKDLGFKPKVEKQGLLEEKEDWKGFEYTPQELQFIQNILGDYLVNLHISKQHPELWTDLWSFLYKDGTFYEGKTAKKRDTTFILYLSVYPKFLKNLPKISFMDPDSERNSDKIYDIVCNVIDGKITYPYAIKELAKIFHRYIQEDQKEGGQQSPEDSEAKCPQCGHKEFEVVGYWKDDGTYVPCGGGKNGKDT